MEIQLKIDLTDEQYNELMTTSYEKLFVTEDFTKALGDVIVNGMADFISKNPDIIRACLCKEKENSYYGSRGRYYDATETAKVAIGKASESAVKRLEDVCSHIIDKVVSDDDTFSKIFSEVLQKAMINGMVEGMREYVQANDNTKQAITSYLNETRRHIGLDDNVHIC